LREFVLASVARSSLLRGNADTALEKVNYVGAPTDASSELAAEGRAVRAGCGSTVAEEKVADPKCLLRATGSAICPVFDLSAV